MKSRPVTNLEQLTAEAIFAYPTRRGFVWIKDEEDTDQPTYVKDVWVAQHPREATEGATWSGSNWKTARRPSSMSPTANGGSQRPRGSHGLDKGLIGVSYARYDRGTRKLAGPTDKR